MQSVLLKIYSNYISLCPTLIFCAEDENCDGELELVIHYMPFVYPPSSLLNFKMDSILGTNRISGVCGNLKVVVRFVDVDEVDEEYSFSYPKGYAKFQGWNLLWGPKCYFVEKIEGQNLYECASKLSIFEKLRIARILLSQVFPTTFHWVLGPQNIIVGDLSYLTKR